MLNFPVLIEYNSNQPMYNGRATQVQVAQPKQSNTDWSRPRKGSYCEYKQEKLSQVSNPHSEAPALGSYATNPARASAVINKSSYLNKTVTNPLNQRRISMALLDADITRPYDTQDKYAPRDCGDYNRATKSRYPNEHESSYQPRSNWALSSQQPPSKNYLQSHSNNCEDSKFGNLDWQNSRIPVGAIVPAGQRKRGQIYQNANYFVQDEELKTRTAYDEAITSKRQSRELNRRREIQSDRAFQMTGSQRGSLHPYRTSEKFRFEQAGKQGDNKKYDLETQPSYILRREKERQIETESMQVHGSSGRFNQNQYNIAGRTQHSEYQIRQPYACVPANPRFNTAYETRYLTDRQKQKEKQRYGNYQREAPTLLPDSKFAPQSLTPTRATKLQAGSGQTPNGVGLSQSRRQLLIEKSKNLSEKVNELSGGKKLVTSSSRDQKQFRYGGEVDQERIERIKNSKDRVYQSPFKDRIKSSVDLRSKYQLQDQADPQTAFSLSSKPRDSEVLKGSELNRMANIERCQEMMKKTNQAGDAGGVGKKENNENQSRHSFHLNSGDSACMNRINALNSKINEKISMLINAYEK